ncbi:MAG: hypothetical protein WD276_05215 [Actinomycetota bacterium]
MGVGRAVRRGNRKALGVVVGRNGSLVRLVDQGAVAGLVVLVLGDA